jgi:membrane protein
MNYIKTKHIFKKIRYFKAFMQFLIKRFIKDRCLQSASALAYVTLLSLVPLLAMTFSMLSVFPAFQVVQEDISNFIFSNFIPTTSETVKTYLQTFTQHTSKLTFIGIISIILSALLLLKNIDRALNNIWRSTSKRALLPSFVTYWLILTLGPILISTGVLTTYYLISLPLFSDVNAETGQILLSSLPFITSTIAFTLLYIVIPNKNISWHSALIGGIMGAILFEVAKRGFALYVTRSHAYETIYGALATVPLFLIWIYVSWIVILLGAEITNCLSIFKYEYIKSFSYKSSNKFIIAFRLIGQLRMAQLDGLSLNIETIMSNEDWQNEQDILKILLKLEQEHWVFHTEYEQWILARDLSDVTLLDLYKIMLNTFPKINVDKDNWNKNLQVIFKQINEHNDEVMNISLKNLIK